MKSLARREPSVANGSETTRMPERDGIGLNGMNGLFLELREVNQWNEAKTVRVRQLRSLDLPIQNDQPLVQQGVFYDQIEVAAR